MEALNQTGLGRIYKMDRCRKYFPRYDDKTFLQEMTYTEGELVEYLPKEFVDAHESFTRTGEYMKVGFWVTDVLFVTFCHKIRLMSRLLGEKTWKIFVFKIAAVALPFSFIQKVQEDARNQFNQNTYRGVHKFYRRYKMTGDILDLNVKIFLEDRQTEIERICNLNNFNLLHGTETNSQSNRATKVV